MQALDSTPSPHTMPRMLGRYEVIGALAHGGMATVYLARHRGEAGFQRLFAIKVLHAHLADDEDFVSMLLDEARIAARLHHPNVVPIVDLGSQNGIHYVVMEYVEGCSLAVLLKKFREERPPRMLIAIALDVLAGLHAAHSLTDDDGREMHLVHRDVSPQNVMVGVDGTARITDFGIARAESRIMSTRPGQLKGKLAFMSPEQVRASDRMDCRSDLFSTGAMLWSALTARRLFLADSDAQTLSNILQLPIPPPSTIGCQPPAALDALFVRALARDPAKRFQSAQEMEEALREAATASACLGSRREVAAWVTAGFGEELSERRKAIKNATDVGRPPMDSTVSSSGVRLPAIGAAYTPSNPIHVPPPVDSGMSPIVHTPTVQSLLLTAPDPALPIRTEPRRRRLRWLLTGLAAALGFVALAAVVLFVARRPGTATASAAQPAEDDRKPVPAPSPSTVTAPVPAPAATASASGAAFAPSAAPPPRAPNRRGAGTFRAPPKPEPTTKPPAEPAPAPTTTSAEPAKRPSRWDKDSPLLPPE